MAWLYFLSGTSYKCTFSRMYIFEIWHSFTGFETERAHRILEKLLQMVPDAENLNIINLNTRIKYISKKLMDYWKKEQRTKEILFQCHSEWLNTVESIELSKSQSASVGGHGGRPKKDFANCSKRSQRRRLAELSKIDQTAVVVLMDTSDNSNTSVSDVNSDEVLSLITEAKLTKHQCLLIKEFINSKKNPVLPSYQKVLEAKKWCYPQETYISEFSAEVELQSLLDCTATRILNL